MLEIGITILLCLVVQWMPKYFFWKRWKEPPISPSSVCLISTKDGSFPFPLSLSSFPDCVRLTVLPIVALYPWTQYQASDHKMLLFFQNSLSLIPKNETALRGVRPSEQLAWENYTINYGLWLKNLLLPEDDSLCVWIQTLKHLELKYLEYLDI